MLDFFSLARGYGLSLGFLMISLYFFVRNNQKYKHIEVFNKDFLFSIVFASLALFSNLSSINYFITILILFSFQFYFYNSFEKIRPNKANYYFYIIILISFIPLYFSVQRLLLLNSSGQLYFGTYSLRTTFNTISASVLYTGGYSEYVFKSISNVLLFGIPLSIIISLFWIKRIEVRYKKIVFLFLIIIVGLFLESLLFHAKFPIGRSTLIYFPLIILLFYFFVEKSLNKLPKSIGLYLSIALFFSLIIPIFIHFKNVNNFSHFADWKYDSHTKEVALILEKETKNQEYKSKISNNWLFEPALNYYISTKKMNLEKATRDSISPESTYIYENYFDYDSSKYKVLIKFDDTKTILLKKR